MKTELEIKNRVRLIENLLKSHEEQLVSLTESKLRDLKFEIAILKWTLLVPITKPSDLANMKMPPIQPFQNIPRATKLGEEIRNEMLEIIRKNPLISRTDIAKAMGRTNAGTISILDILVDLKKIKQIQFRLERKYYHYSTAENDVDMENLLEKKRLSELYLMGERKKARLKKRYNEKKTDKRTTQNNDWKNAKKLVPMLSKMKDEVIVDNEKWTKEFSEQAEEFKRTHTEEEYEEFLNKLNKLSSPK